MTHEFISTWRAFEVHHGGPYVLHGDEALVDTRAKDFAYASREAYEGACAAGTYRETAFHLGLLPQPFHGPVETAEIYLLALNPGFRDADYAEERSGSPFWSALIANYGGQGSMAFLDPAHSTHPGYSWWTRDAGLSHIASALADEFGGDQALAQAFVAQNVAVVQCAPYHSARFARRSAVDRLHSVKLARAFVSDHVLPRAAADACGVVVMWGPWDIEPSAPNVVVHGGISGHRLGPWTRGGELILRRLRSLARRQPSKPKDSIASGPTSAVEPFTARTSTESRLKPLWLGIGEEILWEDGREPLTAAELSERVRRALKSAKVRDSN